MPPITLNPGKTNAPSSSSMSTGMWVRLCVHVGLGLAQGRMEVTWLVQCQGVRLECNGATWGPNMG